MCLLWLLPCTCSGFWEMRWTGVFESQGCLEAWARIFRTVRRNNALGRSMRLNGFGSSYWIFWKVCWVNALGGSRRPKGLKFGDCDFLRARWVAVLERLAWGSMIGFSGRRDGSMPWGNRGGWMGLDFQSGSTEQCPGEIEEAKRLWVQLMGFGISLNFF